MVVVLVGVWGFELGAGMIAVREDVGMVGIRGLRGCLGRCEVLCSVREGGYGRCVRCKCLGEGRGWMSWQCRGIDGGFGGWRLDGGDLVRDNGERRGVLSYLAHY